jgi:IS30 family transposase
MDKYNQITEESDRNKSTIYHELEGNVGDRDYCPKQANHKARQRKSESTKSIKVAAELIDLIEEKLCLN